MENSKLNILNSTPVLVLSTGYEPLFRTNWKKAITAVIGGRAEVVESRQDLLIRTCTGAVPFPSIVRFLSGVLIGKIKKFRHTPRPSKKNLWIRDKGICQYCSKKITISNSTIDHIVPKSKGGRHEWRNIALSCSPCNQKKGSRFLRDTNMSLVKDPYIPNGPDLAKNIGAGFI